MTTDLRTIDNDELVRVSGGHPLVRHLAPHRPVGGPAWSYGAAVALVNGYWDGADPGGDIMVVGPAQDAARLIELVVDQRLPMSVPAEALALLPSGVVKDPHPWGFRWIESRLDVAQDSAGWLTPADEGEIDRLLDDAFPDASFRPDSPRVRGWAGIRDADGRLIACAADTTETPGVGFVAAITTRPEQRGQGLGRAVTGWVLDRLVEREGLAALWHYGTNHAAKAVYDALGMRSLELVAVTVS